MKQHQKLCKKEDENWVSKKDSLNKANQKTQ